jgi:amidophosphoribosyltransferase
MNYYPKHYCGIFGVKDMPNAAELAYYGLYALQHRGQESAGIVSTNGKSFYEHKGMGLVPNIFTGSVLQALGGNTVKMAIGHNRYSTAGGSEIKNAQPLSVECKFGPIALAHNGNLTNTRPLRAELESHGALFRTTTDSEIMLILLAQSDASSLDQAILDMMERVEGAYSLVIMTRDALIAVRDPHGFRPLSLGTLDGNPVVASETCAFDVINARFEREVKPGEVVIFEGNKTRMLTAQNQSEKKPERSFCAFEYVYFARPDSIMGGRDIYSVRFAMGERLANEYPIDADIIVPIPDGGVCAAKGYAKATGIELVDAFIRNHYVGRSFIKPTQSERDKTVTFKLNLISNLVRDKRVVIIDDSIVRGTTSRTRVKRIKEAGAREVHCLVSCPPHRYPCYYGVDFPDRSKLAAASHSTEEIRKNLGLDSLGYLSEEGLVGILGLGHCTACWSGRYPVTSRDATPM